MKSASKIRFILLALFLAVTISPKMVFAESPSEILTTLGNSAFESTRVSFLDLDIENTAINWVISTVVSAPTHIIFNASFDQTMCLIVKQQNLPCNPEIEKQIALGNENRHAGSIFGLALLLEEKVLTDPVIPVNLAFYAKHQAAKIPIISNTAFAQSSSGGIENMLLESIIAIWEQVRNIAYGFLAIFMLVTGVLIMMRKKINPQTVVTVQYAIPRVIIAAILIAFSYPIGAIIFQSVGFLVNIASSLTANAAANLPSVGTSVQSTNLAAGWIMAQVAVLPLFMFIISTLASGGATLLIGVFLLVMWIVAILVILFFFLSVLFKIMGSYFSILASIIVGPIVFAWGAIPGNEAAVTDWFKKQLVNVGSVVGMAFGLGVTIIVARGITASVFAQINSASVSLFQSGVAGFGGGIYLMFGLPLLIVVLLLQIGKIPKQLSEAVLGKKK